MLCNCGKTCGEIWNPDLTHRYLKLRVYWFWCSLLKTAFNLPPHWTYPCVCRCISIRKYILCNKLSFLSSGAREGTRYYLMLCNNVLIFALRFSNRDCCTYVDFHGGASVCQAGAWCSDCGVLVTASQIGDEIDLWTLGFSEFKNVFTTSFYLTL